MKKIFLLSALFSLAPLIFAQQDGEPVYIDDPFSEFFGAYSDNTISQAELKKLDPYIRGGRLYFASKAGAVMVGSMDYGYEFILGTNVKQYKGIYIGAKKYYSTTQSQLYLFAVLGFAEKGKIFITHAFRFPDDAEALAQWKQTGKIVNIPRSVWR
jgi:hypothetical protein